MMYVVEEVSALETPEKSSVKNFVKELNLEMDRRATHTPVEVMIDTVVKASKKAGMAGSMMILLSSKHGALN